MVNQVVVSLLQTQLNHERQNAQAYLFISNSMDNMSYDGFSKFFAKQAQGELDHAQKIADFLISKNIQPEYRELDSVSIPVMSPLSLAQFAYTLELSTTDLLESLYEVSKDNDEYQVCAYLVWFLNEQVEEEKWSFDLQDLLRRTDETGWLILDQQYANK